MPSTLLDNVTAQALQLSDDERAELIERLALSRRTSLHPDWEPELLRRLDEMDAGAATLLPADEVLQELRQLLVAGAGHRR